MTLNELKIGDSAAITAVGGEGALRCRLLDMGLTQKQAVLLMYVISGCLGLSAIALTEVNKVMGAAIVVAILGAAFIGARKVGVLKTSKSVESH